MQKPVEKPIKFVKNLSTKGKSYPITHVSAVIDDNGESVKSTIDSLKNKGSLTKVTWLELKDKRDAGKLIPGSLYRITDYQCTTTQENTRSAGHQFDIVLLALSENKLAEEGWAMMHVDNIYKVVFDDNEVVSCYITPMANHSNRYYVVNVDTLLGSTITITSDRIDEDNKIITLIGGWTPDALADPNLPYNYFQNSNLSAWKVWYCLDNNKDRFAWADDSVDGIDIGDWAYTRNSSEDTDTYYGWYNEVDGFAFTKSPNPKIGDATYNADKEFTPLKVTRVGALVGRGVIYRLIDEWNNDVGYDFKNIVIYLGGKIEKGYLFSSADGDILSDMSLTGIFNDVTVKKTIIDDNSYRQIIDMGILVANEAERCNITVASGALSEDGVNSISSNTILGYTIVDNSQ